MHRFLIILFAVTLSCSLNALQSDDNEFQPNANITDDLTVFLHTGPSRNYRIVGSITAGTPITELERDGDPEFIRIIDSDGRSGWIEGQYLSSNGSIRNEVARLQEEIATVNETLSTLQEQTHQAQSEKLALEQQNKRMATELAQALATTAALQAKVNNADNAVMIEWFTRGGIVAAVCVLLGILITYLPKKRRRNDKWM